MPHVNYKVYCTRLELSGRDFERVKRSLVPRMYDDRDDALAWARDCIRAGLLMHLIEGDDGSALEGDEIPDLIRRRARELTGRPARGWRDEQTVGDKEWKHTYRGCRAHGGLLGVVFNSTGS
jgi:hypothetical protein